MVRPNTKSTEANKEIKVSSKKVIKSHTKSTESNTNLIEGNTNMPQWKTKIIELHRILVDTNNEMTHPIKRIRESKRKIQPRAWKGSNRTSCLRFMESNTKFSQSNNKFFELEVKLTDSIPCFSIR